MNVTWKTALLVPVLVGLVLAVIIYVAADYKNHLKHRSNVLDREISEIQETRTNIGEILMAVDDQLDNNAGVSQEHMLDLRKSFVLLYSDMQHVVSWIPESEEHFKVVVTAMHSYLETVENVSGTDDTTKYYDDLTKFLTSYQMFAKFVNENR